MRTTEIQEGKTYIGWGLNADVRHVKSIGEVEGRKHGLSVTYVENGKEYTCYDYTFAKWARNEHKEPKRKRLKLI